jgi:mannose/fructose-specific phosphotransferase system component IIA
MDDSETRVLVVVNGGYGRELVATAEILVGDLGVEVEELACGECSRDRLERFKERIGRRVEGQNRVLFITDLCGSTPANACLELVRANPQREMICGLSLAMLMKLSTCDRSQAAKELARQLHVSCERSIQLGSRLLRQEHEEGGVGRA